MDNPLTTILTVNYNTSDFIELMLYAFEKLTYYPYKVIVCDNYSSDKEILKIAKVAQKYSNVEVIFREQTQAGSIGHGEAMDLLVSKVESPYFVTMDADCTFLAKDWDKKLISKINGNIKSIGTALPENKVNHKPLDFPLVFAVLYETNTFKKLHPSFMPGDIKQDKSKDTGWQIREKYLSNGYKGIVFKGINTRYAKDTPFDNVLCAVYYFKDTLIASHFSRGSSYGAAKYNNRWLFKIPYFSRFIRKYIGLKEKQQWINLCYSIIDKEAPK